MHFAVHGHTAAELIVDRADADKEHMGLTTWEKAPNGNIVLEAGGDDVLKDAGEVTAEYAKEYAETEFEKYRIIQDRHFRSDFDKFDGNEDLPSLDFKE